MFQIFVYIFRPLHHHQENYYPGKMNKYLKFIRSETLFINIYDLKMFQREPMVGSVTF